MSKSKKLISLFALLSILSFQTEAKHSTKHHKTDTHYTVKKHKPKHHPKRDHSRPNDSITCLTANILNEAGGEGEHGMRAVAAVTMNRLLSGNFARTICGVVYQPGQFSWVGKKSGYKSTTQARRIAEEYAYKYTKAKDVTGGATYFHSGRSPGWKGVTKVKRIGGHIFYRGRNDKIVYATEPAKTESSFMIADTVIQNKKPEQHSNLFGVYTG